MLERTVTGLGYEFVHGERHARSGLLRVFIDRPEGITLDDCAFVSGHLTQALVVEEIEYERLEVSSPGLDRPLTRAQDYAKFAGKRAQVRTRLPISGRRRFTGRILESPPGRIMLALDDGGQAEIDIVNVDRAHLVPDVQFGGRS